MPEFYSRLLNGVVYMMKSIGPSTEPWGTPHDKGNVDDLWPEDATEKF